MSLTPEDLESFKQAYKKSFGEDLNDEDAFDLAYRLDELYRIVMVQPETPTSAPDPLS